MIDTKYLRMKIVVGTLVAAAAAAAWAGTAASWTYKGSIVSRNVRIIDGRPYVPLADVAKVLGGSVAKSDGGYEVRVKAAGGPAGGANQINGMQGKIGQMLFGGKWRFEVIGVTHAPQFSTQYRGTPATVSPAGVNDELVVVNCLVKNGQNSNQQIIMSNYGAANSALTDDQEGSYSCICWDFRGGSPYGPTLIPGSAQKFNLVFSVPKGANLKDLVESISAFGENGGDTFRVSMAQ